MGKHTLEFIAMILVVLGALNWALVGLGDYSWDLVNILLGAIPWLAKTIYILIGISGLYLIYYIIKK